MTDSMTPAKAKAALQAVNAALARKSFSEFRKHMQPGNESPKHLHYLGEVLERIEDGRLKRLIVTLHPGAAKSSTLQSFVPWYVGRDPKRKVITASGGAELAERNSRASRAFFGDERWPFASTLSQDTRSMNRWSTVEGGGLFAIGVGGGVTGWRADLIVCDDLQHDAGTQSERDSLYAWFSTVLRPRLEPGGAIVVVGTRMSEDDIVGRLLDAPDGKAWEHVRLPAIAEEGDPWRAVGEPLWPSRWPLAELARVKVAMGSRAFETQFQANPVPAEGNLIKAEWLQRYDVVPTEFESVICAVDTAAKTGVANDWSAIVKVGTTASGYFVLDVWRDRVEFPELLKRVRMLEREPNPPSTIYVEDTSNAVALNQQLRVESRLPIVPVVPKGSKMSRVEGITGLLESKRVFLPREAPWLLDFEREILAFPYGKNDDMVDAFVLALSNVRDYGDAYASEVGGIGATEYSTTAYGDGRIETRHDGIVEIRLPDGRVEIRNAGPIDDPDNYEGYAGVL